MPTSTTMAPSIPDESPQATGLYHHRHRGDPDGQFNRALRLSESRTSVIAHARAYAAIWGTALLALTMPLSAHVANQVDAVMTIARESGAQPYDVELKTREPKLDRSGRVYQPRDVLIEDRHVWADGTLKCLGWLHSEQPSNSLYSTAWLGTDMVFVAPYARLIGTARRNWDTWTSAYKTITPPTHDDRKRVIYRSHNLCVPIDVLLATVAGARLIDTSTGRIRKLVGNRVVWSEPRPIPSLDELNSIVTSPSDATLGFIFGDTAAQQESN